MQDKNLLIISNIFAKPKKSKFWISKFQDKNLEHDIYIPEIYLDKKATGFLIPYQNKNLTFDKLKKLLTKDQKSNIFLYSYDHDLQTYQSHKDHYKHLAYLDLNNLSLQQTTKNSFYLFWKQCIKITKQELANKSKNIFDTKYSLNTKNYLFPKIYFFANQLQATGKEFKRLLDLFIERHNYKNKASLNIDLMLNDAFAWIKNYEEELTDLFIEFFRELNLSSQKLFHDLESNELFFQELKILKYTKDIFYIRKIHNKTLLHVYNDFKIKALDQELKAIKKYHLALKIKNQKFISTIIKKQKEKLRIIRNYLKNTNNNNFQAKFDLYKNKYLTNNIINFWTKNKSHFEYLEEDLIFDLDNLVNEELNSFFEKIPFIPSSNKFNFYKQIKLLKESIRYELNINFTNFYNISLNNKNKINNIIQKLEKYKKQAQNSFLVKQKKYKDNNHILHLAEQIKTKNAQLVWEQRKALELFKKKLEARELKLVRILKNLKSFQNLTNRFYKYLSKLAFALKLDQKQSNLLDEIKSKRYLNHIVNFSFYFFDKIANFILSKYKANYTFKELYFSILKFIEVYRSLGLNLSDYFIDCNLLPTLNLFKLNLGFQSLKKPRFIFINDLEISENNDYKDQIQNILINLAKVYNFNYVFISHDFKYLTKYYPEIYVFNDYTLLELGYTQNILANPINPTVKSLIISNHIDYSQDNHSKANFINFSFFRITKDEYHYIFINWSNFILWTLKTVNMQEGSEDDVQDSELYNAVIELDFSIDQIENMPSLYYLENNRDLLKDYWAWLIKDRNDNFNIFINDLNY